MSDLRRASPEAVGELQGGEDPQRFADRLAEGPVSRREVWEQLRRRPQAPESYQALLAKSFGWEEFPTWMSRAACSGLTTDKWFHDEVADLGEGTTFPETVMGPMRQHCSVCPVQRECITWAFEKEENLPDHWNERTSADADRFGVYLVPGRIRERFASFPDRVDRCMEWFAVWVLGRDRDPVREEDTA